MSLSKYSKKVWIPDVGSKPHQPLVNFKFPYREFGKQKLVKRAFQHSWFAKWKWLHYEEDMDKAFCYNCIQAYKEDKLRASNLELAFISKGFNNWKDASVKFKKVIIPPNNNPKNCLWKALFEVSKTQNSRSFRRLCPSTPTFSTQSYEFKKPVLAYLSIYLLF